MTGTDILTKGYFSILVLPDNGMARVVGLISRLLRDGGLLVTCRIPWDSLKESLSSTFVEHCLSLFFFF